MGRAFGMAARCLLAAAMAAGLVRAASSDLSASGTAARARLAGAARAAGLDVQAEREATPQITLATLVGVQPGGTAPLTAGGRYTAGSTVRVRRGPFALSNAAVTATSLSATVSVAPGALPAVGTIEVVTPHGTSRAGADALYVAGRWTFDLTAGNGWRVQAVTDVVTPQHANGSLPVAVMFFKAGETSPFETLKGDIFLRDGTGTGASIRLAERQPGSSPECDAVMGRYQKLGEEVTRGVTDKLMADLEKLQAKVMTCMEQQQKATMAMIQKQQDPAYQAAEKARKDAFGCTSLTLTAEAGSAITGSGVCGAKVGRLQLTGRVTHAEK